jgi:hypothetical protein
MVRAVGFSLAGVVPICVPGGGPSEALMRGQGVLLRKTLPVVALQLATS